MPLYHIILCLCIFMQIITILNISQTTINNILTFLCKDVYSPDFGKGKQRACFLCSKLECLQLNLKTWISLLFCFQRKMFCLKLWVHAENLKMLQAEVHFELKLETFDSRLKKKVCKQGFLFFPETMFCFKTLKLDFFDLRL